MSNPKQPPQPDFSDVKGGGARQPLPESRPDFSDVQSGSSSDAMSRDDATQEIYVVKKGDTLSAIAKKYYGDASMWRAIHEANRDLIKNPDLIHIGWELKLPPL